MGVEEMGDHLVEQMPPVTTWGGEFVTVPIATKLAGDIFRILGTNVHIVHGITESNIYACGPLELITWRTKVH